MTFEYIPDQNPLDTVIKVIGVGGAGGNAVEHMITCGCEGVQFITANTDSQALRRSGADLTIQLGKTGLGAGANPQVGAESAREMTAEIEEAIRGTNLLFITAGMGGGTGTGAAPVIAEIARGLGALTVAVVTRPFSFEGRRRMRIAEAGIEELREKVDAILVVLNEKLEDVDPDATMKQCFEMSDDVLYKACTGVASIIRNPGQVNLDFNDLKSVMTIKGSAIIGTASATGPNRAVEAAEAAITCPLLEGHDLHGARGLMVCFTANESIKMSETTKAMEILNNFVSPDASIFYGSITDPNAGEALSITLVTTGLDEEPGVPPLSEITTAGEGGIRPLGELTADSAAPTAAIDTAESEPEPAAAGAGAGGQGIRIPDFLR